MASKHRKASVGNVPQVDQQSSHSSANDPEALARELARFLGACRTVQAVLVREKPHHRLMGLRGEDLEPSQCIHADDLARLADAPSARIRWRDTLGNWQAAEVLTPDPQLGLSHLVSVICAQTPEQREFLEHRSLVHELTQPLAVLSAHARTAQQLHRQKPRNTTELGASIHRIVRVADQAKDTIQGLRAVFVDKDIDLQTVDIVEVVEQALEIHQDVLASHRIRVRQQIDPKATRVVGNPTLLAVVVGNLIRNAIEAMHATPPRQRTLSIETRMEGTKLELQIADRGVGLSVAVIQQLFEPGYTSKEGGLGVGLALSRRILAMLGGSISAKPNAPRGARFIVSLPAWDRQHS